MRQESTRIAKAFIARKYAKAARTTSLGNDLLLHGNRIAWWNPDGSLSMTLAGWGTRTTRDRLNTLCALLGFGRPYHQVAGEQYFDDMKIHVSSTTTFHSIAEDIPLAA